MKLFEITMTESMDNPFPYQAKFDDPVETNMYDDEESDESNDIQTVNFKTDEGVNYLWYAKPNYYDDNIWEVAFGIDSGKTNYRGNKQIDIGVTKSGNAYRVMATALEITNEFLEWFEPMKITFTAEKDSKGRAKIYQRLAQNHLPDNYALTTMDDKGDEYYFEISRQY